LGSEELPKFQKFKLQSILEKLIVESRPIVFSSYHVSFSVPDESNGAGGDEGSA